jgi:hypothetical protein
MAEKPLGSGEIYTETVVWSAPEAHLKDAPYQMAIVLLDAGGRVTARILGDRVKHGHFRGIPRRRALFSEVGMRISFMISDVPAPMV